MYWRRTVSFKTKVLGLSVLGIVMTGALVAGMVTLQKGYLHAQSAQELIAMGEQECSQVAQNVYLMLTTHHETLRKDLRNNLNVVRELTAREGAARLPPKRCRGTR